MELHIEEIVNNIKKQATFFLIDSGEFYPFGSKLLNDNNIVPVGVFIENDNDSQEIIHLLEIDAKESFLKERIICFALGINGVERKKINKTEVSNEVLIIRITYDGEEWYQNTYPYEVKNNIVKWI
jgi:hypothetical protein